MMDKDKIVCVAESCMYNHDKGITCSKGLRHLFGDGVCPEYVDVDVFRRKVVKIYTPYELCYQQERLQHAAVVLLIDHQAALAAEKADHDLREKKIWDEAKAALDEKDKEIAELREEIEMQDNILNPGEYINEQNRDGKTVCVLEKDRWFIHTNREHKARKAEIAKLKAELFRLENHAQTFELAEMDNALAEKDRQISLLIANMDADSKEIAVLHGQIDEKGAEIERLISGAAG